MAGLTAVLDPINTDGRQKKQTGTLTFDASYPTGGESIAGLFNLGTVTDAVVHGPSTNGYEAVFDAANQKVKAFRSDQVDDPEEEVPNTTDLSAESIRVTVYGRG